MATTLQLRVTDTAGQGTMLRAAQILSLAAAPAFAAMAVMTQGQAAPSPMICSALPSPLGGMAPMYLLMSCVHLVPWLRLLSRRP